LDVTILWPPTALTGLMAWFLTVVLGLVYTFYKKKVLFKNNATVTMHWADFATRTFATAVSISLLLVQASGVQLLTPLGGIGTGQLYIAFGLIVSLAILVSNLKQKLDSFVISSQPKQILNSKEITRELLATLRQFFNRYEQFARTGLENVLFVDIEDMQHYAQRLSDELLQINARGVESLSFKVRDQIGLISDKLHSFGKKCDQKLLSVAWKTMCVTLTDAHDLACALAKTLGDENAPNPAEIREKGDFRNAVAIEVRSILKTFTDEFAHREITYPHWSGKTEQSKAALLGKDDYALLEALYERIEARNEYVTSRSGINVAELDILNRKCVEALSQVFTRITWIKKWGDSDSLVSQAKKNVGL
jgi:hypothetical protein